MAYVIACTDLHSAMGPFETWEEAEEVAIQETERSGTGCVWIAIPFWSVRKPEKKAKLPYLEGGVYL